MPRKLKLTDADIKVIKERANTENYGVIAADYGISPAYISYLKHRKRRGMSALEKDIAKIRRRIAKETDPELKRAYSLLLIILRTWKKREGK